MNNNIHIGSMIKARMEDLNISNSVLAKRIHCCLSNITALLKRSSIDTNHLWLISKALQFDFFKLYSDRLEDDFSTNPHSRRFLVFLEVEESKLKELQSNPSIPIHVIGKIVPGSVEFSETGKTGKKSEQALKNHRQYAVTGVGTQNE